MRSDLPSGTVTFLFTDVEGSTRLLHSLGAQDYADALAEHRRVIREACAAYDGVEVDTQGDAFFFAFPSAQGALDAASRLTEALAAGPIHVRVGLHTGTPLVTDEGYVGDDVHFAARLAAAGHGGQVIVSRATAEAVDVTLVDLGEHRLKDISEPVSILQLGDGSFPPLKTIANTNLPTPVSRFLGREEELYEAGGLLEETRLLTITGPGGAGKTRFALELARRAREERFAHYPAGVFSCFLASLRDPALVLPTIAQTLAVGEQPGQSALEALAATLEGKRMLLLLDNLEHLLESAAELSGLLERAPGLTLLVTSREVLRLRGESTYELPPLPEDEGVALFCERAAVEPSESIAQICRRLDGLPLAIELAAARLRVLSPVQLLERLSQRLDLLKGGRDSDPRQQTLRATIEWSHDLLSEDEQQLFARLAVFAGGCTLEAAEEVCDADLDTLQSLVEKSLLRFTDERYWMLATIRDFALERLEQSGEDEKLRARHAARHARLALELSEPLRKYSAEALATVEQEQDNLRATLEFALQRDEVAVASDLMRGLWFYWLSTGRGEEALGWVRRYMSSPRKQVDPLERLGGDVAAAEILRFAGDPETAALLKREVVATGRAHPEAVVRGVAVERTTAATLSDLAYMELEAGSLVQAQSFAEEALALRRGLGLSDGIAHALLALAAIAFQARDFDRARELYAEAATTYEGGQHHGDALGAHLQLAECELHLGRLDEAAALLRRGIPRLPEFSDLMMHVHALRVAARLAAGRADAERCATLLGAADSRTEESGLTLFSSFEDELHRACLDGARDELGEAAFARAYASGVEASDETAFELASSID